MASVAKEPPSAHHISALTPGLSQKMFMYSNHSKVEGEILTTEPFCPQLDLSCGREEQCKLEMSHHDQVAGGTCLAPPLWGALLASYSSDQALEETWSGVSSQETLVYHPGATAAQKSRVTR